MNIKTVVKWALLAMVTLLFAACGDNPPKPNQVKLYGITFGSNAAPAAPAGTSAAAPASINPSMLLELDPATGALIRTIGPTGYILNGLTYDVTTDTLFATTSNNDPTAPRTLMIVDRATGAATPVGEGMGLLAVCPTVNTLGQMYAWWEPSQDDLVFIDKVTGVATRVGESGLSTGEQGLAFDLSNKLWLVNSGGDMYTIDTATGASSAAGNIGQRAHHGQFNPITGKYWGIDVTADSGTNLRNILVVDTSVPSITATLPTADNLHALAFGK